MKLLRIFLIISVVPVLPACVSSQKGGADFYIDHYRCRDAANAISDAKASYKAYVDCMEKSGWQEL